MDRQEVDATESFKASYRQRIISRTAKLPTVRVEVVPDVQELGGAEGAHLQARRLLAFVSHDADCPPSASLRGHAPCCF